MQTLKSSQLLAIKHKLPNRVGNVIIREYKKAVKKQEKLDANFGDILDYLVNNESEKNIKKMENREQIEGWTEAIGSLTYQIWNALEA